MSIDQNGNTKSPGPIVQQLNLQRSSNQQGSVQGQKKPMKERFGFEDKTPWDWMTELIIPIVGTIVVTILIGFATIVIPINFTKQQNTISQQQADQEQQIVDNEQQEAILKTYEDDITSLLFNQNLQWSKEGDEVRTIAKLQTNYTLQRLDPKRKGLLIQFLFGLNLINTDSDVISLNEDNLEEVYLSGSVLDGIVLHGADLSGANLSGAILNEADLSSTLLNHANLNEAFLNNANLQYAVLTGTDLSNASLYATNLSKAGLEGANLAGAELQGAYLLVGQLSSIYSLSDTLLPDGTQCSKAKDMANQQEQATIEYICITQYQKSQWYQEQEFKSSNSQ